MRLYVVCKSLVKAKNLGLELLFYLTKNHHRATETTEKAVKLRRLESILRYLESSFFRECEKKKVSNSREKKIRSEGSPALTIFSQKCDSI